MSQALEAGVVDLIREGSRRVDVVPAEDLLEACLLLARFSWPLLAEAFLLVAWLLEPPSQESSPAALLAIATAH